MTNYEVRICDGIPIAAIDIPYQKSHAVLEECYVNLESEK
jgi:hypothetical protein